MAIEVKWYNEEEGIILAHHSGFLTIADLRWSGELVLDMIQQSSHPRIDAIFSANGRLLRFPGNILHELRDLAAVLLSSVTLAVYVESDFFWELSSIFITEHIDPQKQYPFVKTVDDAYWLIRQHRSGKSSSLFSPPPNPGQN